MGARDEAKTDLVDGAGRRVTYAALVERAPATVTAEQAEEVFATKLARTGAALDALAARIDAEGLDAMIVVGDDQAEHLGPENLPPVLVYHGATLRNTRAEVSPDAPPDLAELIRGYHEPDADVDYPVDVELALGLINHLLDHGFDVATSARLPKPRAEGHALQFPHRRLLRPELPVVPVLLNTYMPPSQPRAARCFDLGVALAAAVESVARDRRIGFLASGGLSHFVVQPEWDRRFLDALAAGDRGYLRSIPESAAAVGDVGVEELDHRGRRLCRTALRRDRLRAGVSHTGRDGHWHGVRRLGAARTRRDDTPGDGRDRRVTRGATR